MPVRTDCGHDVLERHPRVACGAELLEAERAGGHVAVGGRGDLDLAREVLGLGGDVAGRAGQESLHDDAHHEGDVACCVGVSIGMGTKVV